MGFGGFNNLTSYGDGFGAPQQIQQGTFGLLPLLQGEEKRLKRSRVHKAFEECLSRIELDPTRASQAKEHYNAIKTFLETNLSVEIRRVGSFKKHTKIRPNQADDANYSIDVDARVCFGDVVSFVPAPFGTSGSSLLEQLKQALTNHGTYKLMDPKVDHPCVILKYADLFSVELTPCYRNRLSPELWNRTPPSYVIWNRGWHVNDYDHDAKFLSDCNASCAGRLVPLIKLVKRFLRNKDIRIKSFQIELLCIFALVPLFSGEAAGVDSDWQIIFCEFLRRASTLVVFALSIPGSQTPSEEIPGASQIAIILGEWADLLFQLKELGDSNDAIDLWSKCFGAPFPSAQSVA